MKTIKLLMALVFVAIFIFKPNAVTQVSHSLVVNKEIENSTLKTNLEIKQDSVISNLRSVVNQVKKPRVVYITRWRVKERDTIYISGNPEQCDTVFFVVKKNNVLNRIFHRRVADTIRLQ